MKLMFLLSTFAQSEAAIMPPPGRRQGRRRQDEEEQADQVIEKHLFCENCDISSFTLPNLLGSLQMVTFSHQFSNTGIYLNFLAGGTLEHEMKHVQWKVVIKMSTQLSVGGNGEDL